LTKCCDYLFLSPHLDDAVLSCALRLKLEKDAGKKIVVATLFSNGLPLPVNLDLYGGRRSEDRTALQILGVQDHLYLGFSDAPFRNLFYHSFDRIILREHSNDSVFFKKLTESVLELYKEWSPETIFLPLAVGTHIDHRLTHRLWSIFPPEVKIVFYEDRPYSFLPGSLALRLKDIGASGFEPYLSRQQSQIELKSFVSGLKHTTMYKNLIFSRKDGLRYIFYAARAARARPEEPKLTIGAEMVGTIDGDTSSVVEQAVAAYKTQIPALFKDMETFKKESQSYCQSLDSEALYCERYWRLKR